ncbi:nickel-dependent lactate racemase [Thermovenabulum sp.]|uniref:nickel-dependent lactate racemase n=1 Tax=Thermovenabulum sp. TaxID=3100335 RepID=UPI003C7C43B2
MGKRVVSLPYGKKTMEFEIEEENILGVIDGKKFDIILNEEEEIKKALKTPIKSKPLKEMVKEGMRIAIIASDITRVAKNDVVIPLLLDELNEAGIPDDNITIITATGTHRKHEETELKALFKSAYGRVKIIDHDARDENNLVYLGRTSRGTEIYINKRVFDADFIILTGAISYHFMAGFSGGRKSICPGVSGYKTIQMNHKLMLNPDEEKGGIHPGVGHGRIKGNPMAEDLEEICDRVKPDFIINVILDDGGNLVKVVSGDCKEAFYEGCGLAASLFSARVQSKADVLFLSCGGFPKDIDFYQATKAVENWLNAIQDGGFLVLSAECPDGIGHEGFYEIIIRYSNRKEREKALREDFSIARAVGYILTLGLEKINIILVSSMEEKLVREMGMIPARDLNDAVNYIYKNFKSDFKAYVVPHASTIVPFLENNDEIFPGK